MTYTSQDHDCHSRAHAAAEGAVGPDTELRCPTCRALLVNERGVSEAVTGVPSRIWQCEHQHWWMQSVALGWMRIDPGEVTGARATTTGEDT